MIFMWWPLYAYSVGFGLLSVYCACEPEQK